jgi:hypothetical protein
MMQTLLGKQTYENQIEVSPTSSDKVVNTGNSNLRTLNQRLQALESLDPNIIKQDLGKHKENSMQLIQLISEAFQFLDKNSPVLFPLNHLGHSRAQQGKARLNNSRAFSRSKANAIPPYSQT